MPRKKTTPRKKSKPHYQVLTRVDLGKPLGRIDPGSRVVVIELDEEQADPLVAVQALKPTKAAVNYPEDSPSPEPEDPPKEEPEEEPEDEETTEKDDDGGDAKK